MKKILVVTCTKGDGKDTQLVQSLNAMPDDVTLVINANNKVSLSKAYNRQLVAENLIKHDIVLFVHDDVYIDDLKLKGDLCNNVSHIYAYVISLASLSSINFLRNSYHIIHLSLVIHLLITHTLTLTSSHTY